VFELVEALKGPLMGFLVKICVCSRGPRHLAIGTPICWVFYNEDGDIDTSRKLGVLSSS